MQENNQRKGKVYMEIINFILNIVVILLIFLVGLFTKNYLPSYMDKKGENLATKEDIKEITRKTEEVAVSYRFASDHYSGNGSGGNVDVKEKADDEEFRMIKEIVIAIVKDYNQLRKELKLPYNEEEISSGVPII